MNQALPDNPCQELSISTTKFLQQKNSSTKIVQQKFFNKISSTIEFLQQNNFFIIQQQNFLKQKNGFDNKISLKKIPQKNFFANKISSTKEFLRFKTKKILQNNFNKISSTKKFLHFASTNKFIQPKNLTNKISTTKNSSTKILLQQKNSSIKKIQQRHWLQMDADDSLYREAYEKVLDAWMSFIVAVDILPPGCLTQHATTIFNSFVQCHLAAPDGTRGQVGQIFKFTDVVK